MDYARLLQPAQVPLTLRQFADLNHGFFSFTAVSESSRAAAQLLCADMLTHFDGDAGA